MITMLGQIRGFHYVKPRSPIILTKAKTVQITSFGIYILNGYRMFLELSKQNKYSLPIVIQDQLCQTTDRNRRAANFQACLECSRRRPTFRTVALSQENGKNSHSTKNRLNEKDTLSFQSLFTCCVPGYTHGILLI